MVLCIGFGMSNGADGNDCIPGVYGFCERLRRP